MRYYYSLLFLFLSLSTFGQSQTDQDNKYFAEIQTLNAKVVKLFGEKNYDEALKISQNIFQIINQNHLLNNPNTLPALRNLAEIYLVKEKYSDAIATLQIVAGEYEKMGAGGEKDLDKVFSRMVVAYAKKNDFKNVELYLIKQKSLTEKLYGEKSRQSADVNFQLAGVYDKNGKYNEADASYLKSVLAYDAVLGKSENENRIDVNAYECFLYHQGFRKNDIKGAKKVLDELEKQRGISDKDNFDQGIINGKAVNLVKPAYPSSAKLKRASGFALVRVTIDEQGNVINAKATCGFLDFVKEVEAAALKSKFSATTVDGVPVKVTGIIVYNFVAQ